MNFRPPLFIVYHEIILQNSQYVIRKSSIRLLTGRQRIMQNEDD